MWLGCFPLIGTMLPHAAAHAQAQPGGPLESDTVTTRARPGYEPIGIAFGSFRVFPSLTGTLAYNDNIYAVRQPRVDDASLSLKPQVALRSQWQRHTLNLSIDGTFNRYLNQHTENTEQYGGSADGIYAIDGDTRLSGSASFARRIESRGSSGDTLFGTKPIAYREFAAGLNLDRDFGPTRIGLQGQFDSYCYENRALAGTSIDLAARNYQTLSGGIKMTRAIGPGIAVFGNLSLNTSRYTADVTTRSRNSHGYSVIGGVAFGLTRLLQGEIGAGYQRQSFDDPDFPRISGLDYRAELRWSPTRLLSLNMRATRAIQRSPLLGVAGIQQQEFALSADYELRRNLIVHPSFGYLLASFKGIGRTDHYLNAEMKVTWLLNDRFAATAQVARGHARPSDGAVGGRNYDQNRIGIGLTARF